MKIVLAALTGAALLAAAPLGHAEGLPAAQPEEVGLSAERLGRIAEVLRADVEKGRIPGAVVLVARKGKVAWFESVGMRDPASHSVMPKDGIFRIYSMSKPITTVAALILYEEGKLQLTDPVAKHLPQFAELKVGVEKPDGTLDLVAPKRPMTVQDLMRHTSGLTYGTRGDGPVKKLYREAGIYKDEFDNAGLVERLSKLPLLYQPGTTWEYSHSTDVLGRVVEVVSGKSLYAFEKERILDPLGMTDTAFWVEPAKQDRIAEPLAADPDTGKPNKMLEIRKERKYQSGGGGMVSTAADYARFAQMLLNGGTLDGKRILSRKSVQLMTSDHLGPITSASEYIPGDGYGFGLGLAVRRADGMSGFSGTTGDYNWAGAGGTWFWVDPQEELVAVAMIQAPGPIRVHYRVLMKDMVYAAFAD